MLCCEQRPSYHRFLSRELYFLTCPVSPWHDLLSLALSLPSAPTTAGDALLHQHTRELCLFFSSCGSRFSLLHLDDVYQRTLTCHHRSSLCLSFSPLCGCVSTSPPNFLREFLPLQPRSEGVSHPSHLAFLCRPKTAETHTRPCGRCAVHRSQKNLREFPPLQPRFRKCVSPVTRRFPEPSHYSRDHARPWSVCSPHHFFNKKMCESVLLSTTISKVCLTRRFPEVFPVQQRRTPASLVDALPIASLKKMREFPPFQPRFQRSVSARAAFPAHTKLLIPGNYLGSSASAALLPIRRCWRVCVCASSHPSEKLRAPSFPTVAPLCCHVPLSSSSAMSLNPVPSPALWISHLPFLSLQNSPCHHNLFVYSCLLSPLAPVKSE